MSYDDIRAWCSVCGKELEAVRPGKHQHPGDSLRVCDKLQEMAREMYEMKLELDAFRRAEMSKCKYCGWPEDSGVHSETATPFNSLGLHPFIPVGYPDTPREPNPGEYAQGLVPEKTQDNQTSKP